MEARVAWDVTLSGGTVLVDVRDASDISEEDASEIVAQAEQLLLTTDVSLVQFDGLALDQRPTKAVSHAVVALEQLAESYGKQLVIGPI